MCNYSLLGITWHLYAHRGCQLHHELLRDNWNGFGSYDAGNYSMFLARGSTCIANGLGRRRNVPRVEYYGGGGG